MPESNNIQQMEVEDRRLEIRSEPVQEILTRAPSWVVRVGITVVFAIVMLLLLTSWFVKYPDLISAQIVLTDINPPASVMARVGGKIEKLYVMENQLVKKGDYMGYIQTVVNIDDVLKLKSQLDSFETVLEKPTMYSTITIDTSLNLGELQADHSNFLRYYFESVDLYTNDYYNQKISAIQNQINSFYVLNEKLVYQKKILAEDFGVSEKLYDKDQQLYRNKVVSESEFLTKQSGYLQKKYSFEGITVNIINNNIQLSEYQKAILDLKQQEMDAKRSLLINIRDAYRRLLSQIALWEQNYVFVAPKDGKVSFFRYWSKDQYVNPNDEIMTVVGDSSNLVGKVLLPAIGSGKVKPGQTVRVKFDGYPHTEFGVVEGIVTSISQIPRNNQYAVNVEFKNGLITSYKKQLDYKQEMQGTADIVTDDLRLFERIFNQIRSLFDNLD